MAAPTAADLGAVLVVAGVISSIPSSGTEQYDMLTRAMAVAEERLKADTGWDPFESATQTRKYTSDGGNLLWLDQGLLEVVELLIGTTAYVEDTDFWLMPANAIADGKCATRIQFNFDVSTAVNGLTIEGSWGRMSAYGNAEQEALLACGAIIAGANLLGVAGAFGAVTEFVQGDVKRKLKDDSKYGLFENWAMAYSQVVAMHQRILV